MHGAILGQPFERFSYHVALDTHAPASTLGPPKRQHGVDFETIERHVAVPGFPKAADLTKRRLMAHKLRDKLPKLPIAVAGRIINLMDKACITEIIDAIKRAEDHYGVEAILAVFDTWSKGIAAGGGDENKAKDQNIALANLPSVIDHTNVHILTIGHTGKDENRGERGSNAKVADTDTEITVSGGPIKAATVTKANDQPEGPLTSYKLEPFDFKPDEDGDPFRTFIVSQEQIHQTATRQTRFSGCTLNFFVFR